ncbi:NADH-ubiquinone oxidoreductase (complex I), chain 5 [Medicago truncatula]|uniref:NADH-ubiquinone oxidoreductase (Complex I), chain 5 n=1 Tax=Medicago truncatula TaxID=3880 RepID=G7LCU8_MEDTR|nr:NADH-ubiquinone oxidoreductase (complex I), chain 5 [Medicago truncatula]
MSHVKKAQAYTHWLVSRVGSLISTPPVLIRSGPWSSVSGFPADKISEIDQPAGLVWLFLSIEKKESAVCASHLLLGSAGRHAFVTNRVGDSGLLLGILGFYWITGSLEFQDLFQIFNNLIYKNEVNLFFVTLCALLLFCGSVAKSAQFPLHVWLPDAMEGPTPISALIHAATMVARIFLVARLLQDL